MRGIMNYTIAICDDNDADIKYLSLIVFEWARTAKIQIRIETFPSAEAFLFRYADEKSYDILLLDVKMRAMNGIALARQIRTQNETVQIVFITGFPDFIAEGYDVSALHYLMKPVREEKLFAVLDKAAKNIGKSERFLLFPVNSESRRISVGDIACVESFAHSSVITTVSEKLEVKKKISDMEKLLGEGFIRCHRSYIVGIKHIQSISKTEVTLDNSMKLPLSRSNYNAVNQAFIRYFKGEAQ